MRVSEQSIRELVEARKKLDDPMTGAVWIYPDKPEAWLVDVIPAMADDERADEATCLNSLKALLRAGR